ncbi:MAG: hypothetical protein HZB55_05870 [Deltaproteobacteria bacterium]|nr:hypothetical protein [Deltaproteobacteria bacterium]
MAHVHTTWSSGTLTPMELARLARRRGVEAVFLTDHAAVTATRGLAPFENLLAVSRELPSVLPDEAATYLEALREAQEATGVFLVPGMEVTAHAEWSGLCVQGMRRHIAVLGLHDPRAWADLPVPRNFGLLHLSTVPWFPTTVALAGAALAGAVGRAARSRPGRWSAAAMVAVNLAAAGHLLLSPATPWPVQGPAARRAGWQPYQAVLNAVRPFGGLAFWAHPDAVPAPRSAKAGPVRVTLEDAPYPEALLKTSGYVGFEGLIGTATPSLAPGGTWDQAIQAALARGSEPPWSLACQDFHSDSESGGWLGEFLVVLRVPESTEAACLEALRRGEFYGVRCSKTDALTLPEFSLRPSGSGVELQAAVGSRTPEPVTVSLVRDGALMETVEGETPLRITRAVAAPLGRATYFRLEVRGPQGLRLVTNPLVWPARVPQAGAS